MVPISIEECAQQLAENNEHVDYQEAIDMLRYGVERKKAGATCILCGRPIWAVGTAMTEWDGCFTCITGSANDSDDYEIDEVCWP